MFRFTLRKLVWLTVLVPILALVALQYRDGMRVRAFYDNFKLERAAKIEAEAKAENASPSAQEDSN